jgi:predicted DNA-binding transcriptional regulator AlpA
MHQTRHPASPPSCSRGTLPCTPDPTEETFLPARKTWERYGVTAMTIHRWLEDERLNFPPPLYFGRFRYWRLTELEAWERAAPRRTERRNSEVA